MWLSPEFELIAVKDGFSKKLMTACQPKLVTVKGGCQQKLIAVKGV